MGKKGMSAGEKKMAIVKILHDARRPFTLKELEKLASKAGVVQNSVKDLTKELHDEEVIDSEKVGAQVFFWAFPSKQAAMARAKVTTLMDEFEACNELVSTLTERQEEISRDRPESEERRVKLETLETLKKTRTDLEEKLKMYEENDPEVLRRVQAATKEAKQACERWIDSTESVVDWMKKTYGLSRKDALRQMKINEDALEYPSFSA